MSMIRWLRKIIRDRWILFARQYAVSPAALNPSPSTFKSHRSGSCPAVLWHCRVTYRLPNLLL